MSLKILKPKLNVKKCSHNKMKINILYDNAHRGYLQIEYTI